MQKQAEQLRTGIADNRSQDTLGDCEDGNHSAW